MLRTLLLAALASMLGAACSQSESTPCGKTGVVCSPGLVCIEDLSACIDPLTTLCGNGVVDEGEACDDGNLLNHDECNWDCQLPKCGDGFKDDPEVCDDGNDRRGDGCSATCDSKEVCGDRIVNDYPHGENLPAEECDEGGVDTENCNADCTPRICGDGKTNTAAGEQCDGGDPVVRKAVETTTCNIDCTTSVCGDNELNKTAGEQCDIGLECADGTACTTAAQCVGIGDGLCQTRDTDCCTRTCQNPLCGDGLVQPTCGDHDAEVCDGGKRCANGIACQFATNCAGIGDGECKTRNGFGCSADCLSPERCGDGYLNDYAPYNEVCDQGTHCTDGTTECKSTEDCVGIGDGSCETRNGTGCSGDCKSKEVCGDGYLNDYAPYNEKCDDGRQCQNGKLCQVAADCLGIGNGSCEPRDGDGCSADCLSKEVCGDGYTNGYDHPVQSKHDLLDMRVTPPAPIAAGTDFSAPEACDDGNTTDGDGCSSDCLSEERCGDGYFSDYAHNGLPAEICDDGNNTPSDGCSADCGSLEQCGNGVLDPGEECDDNGESDTCALNCKKKVCGNSRKDPGEDCDDGPDNADNHKCLSTCLFNVCGDLFVNESLKDGKPIEECDKGRVNSGECNFDCTLPRCGDSIINFTAGEFCDNGPSAVLGETSESTSCNANCTLAFCGDEIVNASRNEVCDDGNNTNGDGCAGDCKSAEQCGDGIVNDYAPDNEACDNGSTCNSGAACVVDGDCQDGSSCAPRGGDGCSADCKSKEVCGDAYLNDYAPYLETCDDGNADTFDGCDGETCRTEPGWSCDALGKPCTEVCGDLLVRGVEHCDDGKRCDDGALCANDSDCAAGSCTVHNGDGCSTSCEVEIGWTCTLDVDLNLPAGGDGGACTPNCGDFLVRGDETCDDGNTDPGDGCDASCHQETGWTCPTADAFGGICRANCGDGLIVRGEECDDNDKVSGDGCSSTCRAEGGWDCPTTLGGGGDCTAHCGDGIIRGAETCDDSNKTASDGCNASCQVEAGWACPTTNGIGGGCAPICGDSLVKGIETCDDGKQCSNKTSCTTNSQCAGIGDGQCKTRDSDGCAADCGAENGWTCPTAGGTGGKCNPNCGDGLVRGVESCDEGQLVGQAQSNGGCLSCVAQTGWKCPTSGGAGGLCTAICGDGIVIATDEGCDDKNAVFADGCSPACTIEDGWSCSNSTPPSACAPTCGDGKIRGGETCDPPVDDTFSRQGCDTACHTKTGWTCQALGGSGGACTPICGDGLVQGDEACDDHGKSNGDGCTASCQIETGWTCPTAGQACVPDCGDGLIRGIETCDNGKFCENGTTACTSAATCAGIGGGTCAARNGTGCSATCQKEDGWRCTVNPDGSGGPCSPICGDTKVRGAETCDDGNVQASDGCNASCAKETGWTCPTASGVGGLCSATCGDGLIRGGETCDENTTTSSPGCASCQAQAGWSCPTAGGSGGLCTTVCGDKLVKGSETCDDGKHCADLRVCSTSAECAGIGDGLCSARSNTGCSSACTVETGWTCPTAGGQGGVCTTTCHDGFIRGAETCDDSNTSSGDGCSSSCQVETGWNCPSTDQAGACSPICGDRLIRTGETCDDGTGNNTGANPVTVGCIVCAKQDGWSCPTAGGAGGACSSICPDGKVRGAETCDDNNATSGDGCDTGCKLETGWTCATPGSPCTATCGDGLVRGSEQCDDGKQCSNGTACSTNTQCNGIGDGVCIVRASDGCDATCQREDGWSCPASGGTGGGCSPICGDGKKKGSEGCDDGNVQAGDGCNATCALETGWTCTTPGSACTPTCADGKIRGNETCDEGGFTASAGGCVSCQKQTGWTCPTSGGNGGTCTPTCGDAKIVTGETCDEGTNTPSGGCSSCLAQTGWTCPTSGGNGGLCTPTCGDGKVRGVETCDEGGFTSSGGGCTSCVAQLGWSCPTSGGNGGTCTAVCGDGLIRGAETCDEGGNSSGGGCTSCAVQAGWTCPTSGGTGGKCSTICGDALLKGAEQCDDHNTSSGDGCDSGCRFETGWTCPTVGSACVAVCGDSILRAAETCDAGKFCPIVNNTLTPCTSDANCPGQTAGSCIARPLTGCNPATGCTTESGWTCPVSNVNGVVTGGVCAANCGDGQIVTTESCDEGSKTPSGICSSCHMTQDGWTCQANQTCVTVCGDGKIRGAENCDDNDQTPNDGCNGSCQRESGYICPGTTGGNGGDCATCFSTINRCLAGPDCSNSASNATCTTCQAQYEPAGDAKSCVACAANKWSAGTVCTTCTAIANCPTANLRCTTASNQTCTQCSPGFAVNGSGQCVACAANQWSDGITCSTCTAISHCQTANLRCTTSTDQVCSQCDAGYEVNGQTCAQCAANEYSTGNSCHACSAIANCPSASLRCTSNSNQTCAQCNAGFEPSGNTCVACPSGQWSDGTACQACTSIANCNANQVTCTTGTNQVCGDCQDGFHINGQLCTACNSNQYSNGGATCSTCAAITNCPTANLDCDNPSGANDHCTQCDPNFQPSGATCVACPSGQFGNGTSCGGCVAISNCASGLTCTNGTDQTCGTCANGYFGNGTSTCTQCDAITDCTAGNVRCTSAADEHCLDCADGYFINGGSCTQCATNAWSNGTGTSCTTCGAMTGCPTANLRCDAGTGNNVVCATSCDPGYRLNNGQCEACPSGTFGDGLTCTACTTISNCSANQTTCTNASNQVCGDCQDGFHIDGQLCTACGANQWSTGGASCTTCAAMTGCDSANLRCDTGTGNNVICSTTCQTGYRLSSGTCVACASNEYGSGTTCTACTAISNCTSGLTCPTGANTPVCADCANGYFGDGTSSCTACTAVSNCAAGHVTCTNAGDSVCDQCNSPYVVSGGACVDCNVNNDCGTPPANVCVGNEARVYGTPGTCTSHSCSYEYSGTTCANGCFQGACNVDPLTFPLDATAAGDLNGTVVLDQMAGTGATTGTAPAGQNIVVTIHTTPHAGVQPSGLSLVWSDNDFAEGSVHTVVMTAASPSGADDVWTGTIPQHASGATIRFYFDATPWSGAHVFDPGSFINYCYSTVP